MAVDKSLLEKARKRTANSEEKVILSLEEKGFCVALLKDGLTVEKEGRSMDEFRDLIKLSSVSWVDYIIDDLKVDGPKVAASLGFSEQLVSSLVKTLDRSGYEDLDTEMGLLVPVISSHDYDINVNYLLLLMRENVIITLHRTEATRFFRMRRYAKIFMKKIKLKPRLSKNDKMTMLLIRILDENNNRNFDALRSVERKADQLSEKLSKPECPRDKLGEEIHMIKHALLVYMGGLWETVDVLNTLRYGDPELLSDDPRLLQQIGSLGIEVNYQVQLAEHMSEVIASGLEVIQSIYDNQLQILNNKLALLVAYLTVLGTAVLVPNTIATIFGVPFWSFREEFLPAYLAIIAGSTVISVILAYLWVRGSGLLPKKSE